MPSEGLELKKGKRKEKRRFSKSYKEMPVKKIAVHSFAFAANNMHLESTIFHLLHPTHKPKSLSDITTQGPHSMTGVIHQLSCSILMAPSVEIGPRGPATQTSILN